MVQLENTGHADVTLSWPTELSLRWRRPRSGLVYSRADILRGAGLGLWTLQHFIPRALAQASQCEEECAG